MGLDWLSVATEASGGGTPDPFSVLEVLGHVGIYGCREDVGGATGVPRDRGACPRGGAPPCVVDSPWAPGLDSFAKNSYLF